MVELLQWAREALHPMPKRIAHYHERGDDCGLRCIETHLIAGERSTFSGKDIVWGPSAAMTLFASWDIHARRYESVWAMYPLPDAGVGSVDLSAVLA